MPDTWIVPEGRRRPAADLYPATDSRIQPVEAAILHYTASRGASGTLNHLTKDDEAYVSAHFLVARNGITHQMVPLDARAWHAGGRSSRLFGRGGVNFRTIGIEMMNVGPLRRSRANRLMTWWGSSFDGPIYRHPPDATPKYDSELWEAYSMAQITAVARLLRKLFSPFPILQREPVERIIGHEHVDPTRKTDPGPAFPWTLLRQLLD